MRSLFAAALMALCAAPALADPVVGCRADHPVMIQWKDSWYPGRLLKGPDPQGRCYVTYDGYDSSWNEWAGQMRLREKGVPCDKGTRVEIEWKGGWYAGVIDNGPGDDGSCHVQYDGYGREWDEWAGQSRLRLPTGSISDKRLVK